MNEVVSVVAAARSSCYDGVMERKSKTADAMKRAKYAQEMKLTPEERILLALRLGARCRMLARGK